MEAVKLEIIHAVHSLTHGNPDNWRAGKRLSASKIVKHFPPHDTYVEPFAGRAYVFFKNDKKPSKSILNDLDCKVLRELKKQKCSLKDKSQCERLNDATVKCGEDWKKFLRYDSKNTLFYLDPPYENNKTSDKYYQYNDVPLKEVLEHTKHLKGTVVLSYSPDRRKEICNEKTGFKCKVIHTWSFANPSTEILAIKKARGPVRVGGGNSG